MNEVPETPTTIKEVGIHMAYMRAAVDEIKRTLKDLTNNFVNKEDFETLVARVSSLENKNSLKNTLLWVGLVASAIINIVVIYQLFTGK